MSRIRPKRFLFLEMRVSQCWGHEDLSAIFAEHVVLKASNAADALARGARLLSARLKRSPSRDRAWRKGMYPTTHVIRLR